jgi:uncharacterized membrane protein YfcA
MDDRRGRGERGDRRVGLLLVLLGAAVCGLTAAVGAGLITGVRAAWPAYLVGGVTIVIGLVQLRRPREPVPAPQFPSEGREVPPRGRPVLPPAPPMWHDPTAHLGGGEPNGRE